MSDDFTIDDMARAAGTIAYEVLTRLSTRMRRRYVGGGLRANGEDDRLT
ncbi:MAG: alanine racemase C-terminal domain-containing protein [Pseudomonadota bacterium]